MCIRDRLNIISRGEYVESSFITSSSEYLSRKAVAVMNAVEISEKHIPIELPSK